MPRLLVASTNPVKAQAVLDGFQRMFPDEEFELEKLDVPSGVPDQPASDTETHQGAVNRARTALREHPGWDYYVGIEGGIQTLEGGGMHAFAWIVVLSDGRLGQARSGTFELPPAIVRLIRQGVELGEADDRVFNRSDSKRKDGAVGILTGGVVDRRQLYAQAVLLALAPFKNPQYFQDGND
jgi:inosine/xanthosine triphosphatase